MTSEIIALARSIRPETLAAIERRKPEKRIPHKHERYKGAGAPTPKVTAAVLEVMLSPDRFKRGFAASVAAKHGVYSSAITQRIKRLPAVAKRKGLTVEQLLNQLRERTTATGN